MEVDRVKATLRYSAEAKGAWRSLEIGAEKPLLPPMRIGIPPRPASTIS
jgi:hypothetical protein